ncbi:bifunctional tRNA (5-methylaminomethyl-2-thiouridine)(34)-methyltransferase MnmD/FAD-dependent 5-carboxymethylaminomethyl-2-thiouridine(34) oxidoreductase MnmC [Paraferrimonas haliotis]|uniref:tRNA 5-methylaminomethyl-2-thiouridine biosynthesis bifunctional protein MnmC n=1 Tax=Paraferrimonas haliotis TaxID=2013866 RepID=A0AA37TNF9_9GAMM|nr:bifunctional tRNA (5-methylaminomethyl-2-thiouridine)(34)-methyltransferase MnmD/FAD-dependent 5-carboxymethylaminomethyl-2-thiouridine(34) oxidoreductase MnmC [Paraferrimonas haliotis]GLS82605.1 tRNA 5-methylaminomethyl-2-thiouridine biosynthesis bifunctional protein MnmC [Paraferrimonas haliotis]
MTIKATSILFRDGHTPVSTQFDDVYYSSDNGLAESRYVFLDPINLESRLAEHSRPFYVIAETGFGTGLNFLATWQAFEESGDNACQRLYFVSFEKYPLPKQLIAKAHSAFAELAPYSQQFLQQYPVLTPGVHRLIFNGGRVVLDLWIGDLNDTLSTLYCSSEGLVDSWYLDGFTPSKNPEMWSDVLFKNIARLSRSNANLATFTCAGVVRRGLQGIGFELSKSSGYGLKREKLFAQKANKSPLTPDPLYPRIAAQTGDNHIAIIGGGIASAMLAISLLEKGHKVTVFCKDQEAACGASGNNQGALYPLLNSADAPVSQWYVQAFQFALQRYRTVSVRTKFPMSECGVLVTGFNDKSRLKLERLSELTIDRGIAYPVDSETASELAGVDIGEQGWFYPRGAWLSPRLATQSCFEQLSANANFTIQYHQFAQELIETSDGWQIVLGERRQEFSTVVLANGAELLQFKQTAGLATTPVRGQVSHIPSKGLLSDLRCVLCADGYLTPAHRHHHCMGASHQRQFDSLDYSHQEQLGNLARMHNSYPNKPWLDDIDIKDKQARIGVRLSNRDHLPFVGACPDFKTFAQRAQDVSREAFFAPSYTNLYLLAAFGSRGLCSAPLAAELLASELAGEPLPASIEELALLHPNRYWSRRYNKGRPLPQTSSLIV